MKVYIQIDLSVFLLYYFNNSLKKLLLNGFAHLPDFILCLWFKAQSSLKSPDSFLIILCFPLIKTFLQCFQLILINSCLFYWTLTVFLCFSFWTWTFSVKFVLCGSPGLNRFVGIKKMCCFKTDFLLVPIFRKSMDISLEVNHNHCQVDKANWNL